MKGKLEASLIKDRLPGHVVIIMDGNGRWAKRRGLDRVSGHREGMKSVKSVLKAAKDLGIGAVTLYAFSAQNWQRPPDEVSTLMHLLENYLKKEERRLVENDIRLSSIGRLKELPQGVYEILLRTMEKTKHCGGMRVTLALSYGGREEIVDAARELLKKGFPPNELGNESFSQFLYTYDLPDPDLLIRTGGEMRISNFLLWQLAYSEIYVTKTLWPDFRRRHFIRALLSYQRRERRFGLTSEQIRGVEEVEEKKLQRGIS